MDPQPAAYKAAALPVELLQRVPAEGIEPTRSLSGTRFTAWVASLTNYTGIPTDPIISTPATHSGQDVSPRCQNVVEFSWRRITV